MRNISGRSFRENRNKPFLYSETFSFFENHIAYEIMWKNIVERSRSQMTIWRMRIACWIPKATKTHTQIV